MNISTVFPSKYARGIDLQNKTPILKIASVVMEKMADTVKPVIYFHGAKRGVVLSPKLARQIAEIIGDNETDRWVGHSIMLYADRVRAFGEWHSVIRAKPAQEKGKQP